MGKGKGEGYSSILPIKLLNLDALDIKKRVRKWSMLELHQYKPESNFDIFHTFSSNIKKMHKLIRAQVQ